MSNALTRMQLATKISIGVLCILAVSCTSTQYVKPDYAPRLSTRAVTIEQAVKATRPASVEVLPFSDRRGERDERYRDPKLVWRAKIYEYRLQSTTLASYLRDALVFDLARVGLTANPSEPGTPPFSGKFTKGPASARFLLAVEVLECRPDYDTHFVSVSPFYVYEYNVKLWDSTKAALVGDKQLKKRIAGVGEPGISFATLIDRLLNDHLPEIDFEIAELLLNLERDQP